MQPRPRRCDRPRCAIRKVTTRLVDDETKADDGTLRFNGHQGDTTVGHDLTEIGERDRVDIAEVHLVDLAGAFDIVRRHDADDTTELFHFKL